MDYNTMQPWSTQPDPPRIFVRFWEVSTTHEFDIALRLNQYYGRVWTCYSTLLLLRTTSRLNKILLYISLAGKKDLESKDTNEIFEKDCMACLHFSEVNSVRVSVYSRKRGKFQHVTCCFQAVKVLYIHPWTGKQGQIIVRLFFLHVTANI